MAMASRVTQMAMAPRVTLMAMAPRVTGTLAGMLWVLLTLVLIRIWPWIHCPRHVPLGKGACCRQQPSHPPRGDGARCQGLPASVAAGAPQRSSSRLSGGGAPCVPVTTVLTWRLQAL